MRLACAIALLLCAAPAAAQTDAAWMGVAGASAERIAEPVFDGHVAVYRAGPRGGAPVVLVHGLGPNGARDWARIVPALAQRHEVWALDLPGFGASGKGNHLYDPANYARVIERALAPKVGRRFALVGHSMGGAVALAYAGAYPARVERLVLLDAAGVLHGAVYAESLAKLGIAQATGLSPESAPWLDALLRTALARVDALALDSALVLGTPALRQKMLRGDPSLIAAYALGEHDFSETLRQVAAPTLVLWGERDAVAPLRTGRVLAATIPGARLHVLPGLAHAPQLEDPKAVSALLLDELAGRGPAPAARAQPASRHGATTCDGRDGVRYSGHYEKLTLIRCRDVTIADAQVGALRVLESEVSLVNAQVAGGLYALRSRVEITGGTVRGAPALTLQESEVDAAGTRLEGDAIAENLGATVVPLRLSVAELHRDGQAPRHAHDLVRLAAKSRW